MAAPGILVAPDEVVHCKMCGLLIGPPQYCDVHCKDLDNLTKARMMSVEVYDPFNEFTENTVVQRALQARGYSRGSVYSIKLSEDQSMCVFRTERLSQIKSALKR